MLRCPEPHREEMLVLSTGEVKDRMVRSGLIGCPVCHKEYPIGRGVVVGADLATSAWLVEAHRVLLRGRRFVVENEEPELPIGLLKLAAEQGLWVGEKR